MLSFDVSLSVLSGDMFLSSVRRYVFCQVKCVLSADVFFSSVMCVLFLAPPLEELYIFNSN